MYPETTFGVIEGYVDFVFDSIILKVDGMLGFNFRSPLDVRVGYQLPFTYVLCALHPFLQNVYHVVSQVFIDGSAAINIKLLFGYTASIIPDHKFFSVNITQLVFHLFAYVHVVLTYLVRNLFNFLFNSVPFISLVFFGVCVY